MSIDRDMVKHVAFLARLSLADEELPAYCSQLSRILDYINHLNEVNTDGVLPTSHPISTLKNVYRKDIRRPSLCVEEALKNAPSKDGTFFRVPRVIDNT